MIRLHLMLERSRIYESTFIRPAEGRRFRPVQGGAVWYLGIPFCPRRAASSPG